MSEEMAIFAGGCFWCMVQPFDSFEGVIKVTSGYTGGDKVDPTYEEVYRGGTGHYEAVEIKYNPELINYDKLLDIYFKNIDPTDPEGQFNDKGESYRPAIFYTTEEQKNLAEEFKRKLEESKKFDKPIVVEILPAKTFYRAEEYHQDFYKKETLHYTRYKKGSGREDFINDNWKK